MVSSAIGASSRRAQIQLPSLLDQARKASGLSDFGDEWFMQPLAEVVRMINEEAGLKSADEPPVQGMVKNLADRLQLVEYLKRHPEALDEKIDVAGVIIGLGRGGSTLLQRLLSASPQVNYTPWWEVVFPLPLPGEQRGDPTPRIELGKRTASHVNEVWPEMVAMHPVDALEADEEIALFDRTPHCMMYSFYFYVPSYMPWLRKQDQRMAYQELKTWLKVMQHQQPSRRNRRWLLKSGNHLYSGALRPLLDTFPEALAIMTHRKLQNVIVSYCSMQTVTIQKYSDTFDRRRLGHQAMEVFSAALRDLQAVRLEYPADRFLDVQYEDTVKEPLQVFRSSMRAMKFDIGAADEEAAARWMASHGRDTHPAHRYSPEDYGITQDEVAKNFRFYHDAFLRA
jgi:hypothetical protein